MVIALLLTRKATALCALAVAFVATLAPVPSPAQTPDRVYRVGFLGQTNVADMTRQLAALREGLRQSGYDEGRNLTLEYRWAERKLDRLPALAAELAGSNVDVIVTHGSAGSRAAKDATSTIPIVIAVIGDPVASGVVGSLSRPGGNVTGLVLQELESTVQWLRLLRDVVPQASVLGWLEVPDIERLDVADALRQQEDGAAKGLGFDVKRVMVRGGDDLPAAFERLSRGGVHAVVVPNTSLLNPLAAQIAGLATAHRLPSVGSTLFARAGGVLGYGPDGADMYRRAARYVDAVLKGTWAGDLAMEPPSKFELAVNLKAARAIGLTVPAALAARADQRIE